MSEPTFYHKCERCGGRAGWTEPNTLEWVECEADGCDLGVVPVKPDYEAALKLALAEVESGVVYDRDEWDERMIRLVRSMVDTALGIGDNG